MGNDNSKCLGEFGPKSKKCKRSNVHEDERRWSVLPSIVLHNIFSRLDHKDRIRASSTCHVWRQNLYHPKFWRNVTFKIYPDSLAKAQYFRTSAGHMVTNATIRFDSLSTVSVAEFLLLMQHFNINDNLKSLVLEPSHCHIDIQKDLLELYNNNSTSICSILLNICHRRPLTQLSLGLIELLAESTAHYLQLLADNQPRNITLLGLATVKDNPGNYVIYNYDPSLFAPFRKLQILSIDYDVVRDSFLESLEYVVDLQRLVIHVHGILEDHPGTSEQAWQNFKLAHPNSFVRLSLIHTFKEVSDFEQRILRKNMPLSHIKVLFCENINVRALDFISTYYKKTIRSIMWVDSLNDDRYSNSWTLARNYYEDQVFETNPDPLIIMAWLCQKLEEIVFIGYKYLEEDLIGIGRLRDTLKKLEFAEDDVLYSDLPISSVVELSLSFGRDWAPLSSKDLHPVLLDPNSGDSDEYILPYLLADIHEDK